MLDNDAAYIGNLVGVVESVDELSSLQIIRTTQSWHFRLAPSIPLYLEPLLHAILKLNTVYGIHLDLSKSMKACSTITFDIPLTN